MAACFASPAAAQTVRFFNYTTTAGLGSNTVRGIYASGSTVYAATSAGLSISTDDGMTYTNYVTSTAAGGSDTRGVYAVGNTVYAATNGGGLAISTDGGLTYTVRNSANGLGTGTVYSVFASGSNVYAATNGGLGISTNGGTSFTNYTTGNGLGNGIVNGVYASDGTVYAATSGGLSISTTGTSFTNSGTSSGLGNNLVRGVYATGSTVYAATSGGLSISTNGGSSYTNYTTANGLGNNNVNGVYASGSTIYAATQNGLGISTNGGTSFTNYTSSSGISPGGLGGNVAYGVYASGSTVYVATNAGVSMSIAGPLALTWSATSGVWNTQASQVNWQTRGTASTFYVAGDAVTFGQTVGGTVTLSGALAPSAVAVTAASGTYTFAGSGLNAITGSTGLSKSGQGTLVLSAANSYTGTTALSAGTLRAGANGSFGTGMLALAGGTLASTSAASRDFANAAVIGGDVTFGDDTGTGGLTLSGNVDLEGAIRTLTTAADVVITGTVSNGSLTKSGVGRLTLARPNSYSGITTISSGTLALSGSGSIGSGGLNLGTTASPGGFDLAALVSGTYFLPATGDLSGVGTLTGAGKSLAVLGSFRPGNSPGTVTVDAGFTLDLSQSGTSVFEITSPLYTAGTYDLVSGAGSLIFGGVLQLDFSNGPYASGTNVLQLFANSGGRAGSFTSVVSTGLGAGQYATFDAATGFISVVPEPSTYAMALAGLAYGGFSMWRRRKRACVP